MSDFNDMSKEYETDFGRPDEYQLNIGRRPFERGQGSGGQDFDSVMAGLKSQDKDVAKQSRIERRKMGEEANRLGLVKAAQEIVSGVYAIHGDDAINQLNSRVIQYEQAVRVDPDFDEYKNAKHLHSTTGDGGIASEIFKKEVQILKYQVSQDRHPDPSKKQPEPWYRRDHLDYIHPETKNSKTNVASVSQDDEENTFSGAAGFNPAGGGNKPPTDGTQLGGVPPTPPENPEPKQSEDPLEFTNKWLQAQYNFLKNKMIATPFETVYGQLVNRLEEFDSDEAERFGQFLEQRIGQIHGSQQTIPQGTAAEIAEGFRAGYTAVLREQRLQSRSYLDFLRQEEWNEAPTPVIGDSGHPDYWIDLSQKEKDIVNIRRQLNNLAYQKRTQGVADFEAYGKIPEVNNIQTKEMRLLCENMPGFERALQEYANMFVNSEADRVKDNEDEGLIGPNTIKVKRYNSEKKIYEIVNISTRELESEEEDTAIRIEVRKRIKPSVKEAVEKQLIPELKERGATDQQIEVELEKAVSRATLEAELAAFNALYGTNAFESWVEIWEDKKDGTFTYDTSRYGYFIAGRFTNPALVEAMYPLTVAINKGKGKAGGAVHEGKHHAWVKAQMQRLLDQHGVPDKKTGEKKLKYDTVQTVDTNDKGEAKRTFWTLRDGVLYVPEVYLHKVIESPWERYTDDTINRRRLIDELLDRRPINWSNLRNQDDKYEDQFTGNYGRDSKKAQTIANANINGVGEPKRDDPMRPERTLDKAMEKFPKYRNLTRLRYIFYPNIYPLDNIPYMEGEYITKNPAAFRAYNGTREANANFFRSEDEVFFDWDSSRIEKKVKTNKR